MATDQGVPFIEDGRVKRRWSNGEITDHGPVPWGGSYVRPEARDNGEAAQSKNKFREQLLTMEQLDTLPEPEWLIEGLIPKRAFAVVYGKAGHFKSFLALDWACSVAMANLGAEKWMGHAVCSGFVMYVAAEGTYGLSKRRKAWEADRRLKVVAGLGVLPAPVNLLDPRSVGEFTEMMVELKPTLIIIDTLARCLIGGDENSARDMGIAVDAVTRLIAATGATILLIHHKGRAADNARGSSALDGAADTMIEVLADGESMVTLKVTKQKDAEGGQELALNVKQVSDSVVLVVGSIRGALSDAEMNTAKYCHEAFGSESFSSREGLVACGLSERTYYRARKALVDKGFLVTEGSEKRPRYRLTEEAIKLITATYCQAAMAANQILPPTATIFSSGSGSNGRQEEGEGDPVDGLF